MFKLCFIHVCLLTHILIFNSNPHYADHDMSHFFNDFKHNIFQQKPNESNEKDHYMLYLQKEFVLYDKDDVSRVIISTFVNILSHNLLLLKRSNNKCDPKVMFQISTNLGIDENVRISIKSNVYKLSNNIISILGFSI